MPAYPPSQDPKDLSPRRVAIPDGTELWRCHLTAYRPGDFNPLPAHPHFGGGRFDGTDADPYTSLYVGDEPVTALAEVLLRGMEFTNGSRLVPRAMTERRSLSRLCTVEPLQLIALETEEDLAAVGQDGWLVEADGRADYPQTRCWAQALRRSAPWAQGMTWQSHRCRPRRAFVLFGDRCGPGAVSITPLVTHDLGTAAGRSVANQLLSGLKAAIVPPDGEAQRWSASDV
ncbi:RES family NAD+ phosphorylase [Streptomyces sp. B6B3]|uniref:RES family NAD+ phosphorylase n=1 Tax=Streptomyces sp. B6B3 TaxID=3153570 RepID=UPI00325F6FAD